MMTMMLRVPGLFGWTRDVASIVIVVALAGCGAAEAGSRTTAPSPTSRAPAPAPDRAAPDPEPRSADLTRPTPATRPPEAVDDPAPEPEPVDILFVGNSYTHFNDMPELLSALAADAELEVEIDAYTAGGAKLVEHAASDGVHRKLAEREWDFVVLQAHSLEVFRNPEGFDEAMDALASEVSELGAEPVSFETWSRRAGHNVLRWYDLTPETMQDALLSAYTEVCDRNDARLAPVGEAWRQVHAVRPDAGLHLSDGSHPSIAGSYLTACVMFNVLLDARCSEVEFVPEGLEPELADVLREVADATVEGF